MNPDHTLLIIIYEERLRQPRHEPNALSIPFGLNLRKQPQNIEQNVPLSWPLAVPLVHFVTVPIDHEYLRTLFREIVLELYLHLDSPEISHLNRPLHLQVGVVLIL